MIDVITRDRLKAMRLTGLVDCLDQLDARDSPAGLTTADVVKMITDREWERRRNSKLARLRRAADLAQPHADIGDIRVMPDRTVDTDLIGRLAIGNYIAKHEDVVVPGPTGSGKTYVACALGNKACQQYKSVLHLRAVDLFDRLTLAERAGTRGQTLAKLVGVDLLILDEWFTSPPSIDQVRHLHALMERRTGAGSTVFCSQIPPAEWHDQIEEKVIADAIVDRITANARKITLTCKDSLRRLFKPVE